MPIDSFFTGLLESQDPNLGGDNASNTSACNEKWTLLGGAEAVQPNKRLDQERLVKLVEIGFAFSAKHLHVPRKPSGQPGESKAASRWSDNQWALVTTPIQYGPEAGCEYKLHTPSVLCLVHDFFRD